MKLSHTPLALALLLWGFFAMAGLDAMSDIAAQGVPGYPNAGQRNYYLHFPLVMAVISLLFLGVSWRWKWASAAGCLGSLLILLWFPYILFYTGGV